MNDIYNEQDSKKKEFEISCGNYPLKYNAKNDSSLAPMLIDQDV